MITYNEKVIDQNVAAFNCEKMTVVVEITTTTIYYYLLTQSMEIMFLKHGDNKSAHNFPENPCRLNDNICYCF